MKDESHNVCKFQSKHPLGCDLRFEGPEIVSLASVGEGEYIEGKKGKAILGFHGISRTV